MEDHALLAETGGYDIGPALLFGDPHGSLDDLAGLIHPHECTKDSASE